MYLSLTGNIATTRLTMKELSLVTFYRVGESRSTVCKILMPRELQVNQTSCKVVVGKKNILTINILVYFIIYIIYTASRYRGSARFGTNGLARLECNQGLT